MRIFFPGSGRNGIQDESFILILGLSQPGLDSNIAGMMFFNFLLFFLEFSIPGRVGMEFGKNFFFSLFLDLSQPGLDRNNARMKFLKFF